MKVDEDLLLLLKSSGIGEGEPDLGEKLMGSFLSVLYESGKIPAVILCMNSGVFLTTDGSSVVDVLRQFAEAGSEIASCGTCLEYYGRTDKLVVGRAGNMRETVNAMLEFKKVLAP